MDQLRKNLSLQLQKAAKANLLSRILGVMAFLGIGTLLGGCYTQVASDNYWAYHRHPRVQEVTYDTVYADEHVDSTHGDTTFVTEADQPSGGQSIEENYSYDPYWNAYYGWPYGPWGMSFAFGAYDPFDWGYGFYDPYLYPGFYLGFGYPWYRHSWGSSFYGGGFYHHGYYGAGFSGRGNYGSSGGGYYNGFRYGSYGRINGGETRGAAYSGSNGGGGVMRASAPGGSAARASAPGGVSRATGGNMPIGVVPKNSTGAVNGGTPARASQTANGNVVRTSPANGIGGQNNRAQSVQTSGNAGHHVVVVRRNGGNSGAASRYGGSRSGGSSTGRSYNGAGRSYGGGGGRSYGGGGGRSYGGGGRASGGGGSGGHHGR